MRPDWDSYFMKIAYAVSERSTCDGPLLGCVLVLEKRNPDEPLQRLSHRSAALRRGSHLMVDGHCIRTIHAETNAIIQAALHGVSTKGATCYVTHLAVHQLHQGVDQCRIVRLVYRLAYRTGRKMP